MHRYLINTSQQAQPGDAGRLERAFARLATGSEPVVVRVEVSGGATAGGFVIGIDVLGPRARAQQECERLFLAAWYDAFGARGSTHIGSFSDTPRPRSREVLAA